MILNDSSSSWVWLAKVIRMVLLESAIELNPSARGHRSPLEFQVTHIGYGESWEKYSVVDAYLMKNSHHVSVWQVQELYKSYDTVS